MKIIQNLFIALFLATCFCANSQEKSDNYIEFNDRNNIVHGVYLGISGYYGRIEGKDTYTASFKIAYVSNQEFEIGFVGTGFYSDQNIAGDNFTDASLLGFYGGFHIEPILFSKRKVNLSFPILFGGGAVGVVDGKYNPRETYFNDEWDAVFAFEPGINILYNLSRYVQLEFGVKHRFLSNLGLDLTTIESVNGFSFGMGFKIGVFNMGRNRYKKKI